MAVQCPPELFEFFEKSCGSWIDVDESTEDFLYDAQAESICEGHCFVSFPPLSRTAFNDWGLFESWCEKVSGDLYEELLNSEGIDLDQIVEGSSTQSPKDFFTSRESLIKKIIVILIELEECDVSVVTVSCSDSVLYLGFLSSQAWALGFGGSVFVMRSKNELSRKNGFYTG
jgi:hypothetical protein